MAASTVFVVLTVVLGVVYGLDLTKTASFCKNEEVVKSGGLLDKPTEVVNTSEVSKSTSTLVDKDGIVSSVTKNPTEVVDTSELSKSTSTLVDKDGIVSSVTKNPTEVVDTSELSKSTSTLVDKDGIVTSVTKNPTEVVDTSELSKSTSTLVDKDGIVTSITKNPIENVDTSSVSKSTTTLVDKDGIVSSVSNNPTEKIDTSSVSKSTTLLKQEEIMSSLPSNPTTVVSKSSVVRTLAKRCHCNKGKPEGGNGCFMKETKEKSCPCSESGGMKTREIMEKEGGECMKSKQEYFEEKCKSKDGDFKEKKCKCGKRRQRFGCRPCMEKEEEEERRPMNENQCKGRSDIEKEEFMKMNKDNLAASLCNEEMKRKEIEKLGKECGLSNAEIQKDLNKSRNLGHIGMYQYSGDMEAMMDRIKKMENQRKDLMSEKEREQFMTMNENQRKALMAEMEKEQFMKFNENQRKALILEMEKEQLMKINENYRNALMSEIEKEQFMKMNENQRKALISELEKQELMKMNKDKLSAMSYNEEMKINELKKMGKECGLSDAQIQNDINKIEIQKYQSSGNEAMKDRINKTKQREEQSLSSSSSKSNAEKEMEKEQMSSSSSSSSSRSSSYKSGYDNYGNQLVEEREVAEECSCSK